jgi:hypothetical protein
MDFKSAHTMKQPLRITLFKYTLYFRSTLLGALLNFEGTECMLHLPFY